MCILLSRLVSSLSTLPVLRLPAHPGLDESPHSRLHSQRSVHWLPWLQGRKTLVHGGSRMWRMVGRMPFLRAFLSNAELLGCGCILGCSRAGLKRQVAWHDPLPPWVPAIVPLLRGALRAKLAGLGGMCLWQVGGDTCLHCCLPSVSGTDACRFPLGFAGDALGVVVR